MRRFLCVGFAFQCALILTVSAFCVAPAFGVSTSHWVNANEADFKAGTIHNVVVTNLGDVKLSRAVQAIQEQDPDVTTVNALAQGSDGIIYAGTGPKGILLSVKDDKAVTLATIADAVNILSVIVDDKGAVVVGTGGDKGRVLKIEKPGDSPKEIFSSDGVQYIWALRQTSDGNIYAATGPNGQVFEIKPDGTHSEIYKSSQDNITSLISDGKDLLYLGTDPSGLVVRLNRQTKESFVVYNAGETEITALALDGKGNLYAATGEAGERQNQPPGGSPPEKKAGRPEQSGSAAPIPPAPAPKPPSPPTPPPLPNPNPKPIPKNHAMRVITDFSVNLMDVAGPATDKDDPGAGGSGPDQPGGDQPGNQPGGDVPGAASGPSAGADGPGHVHPSPSPTPANSGENQTSPEGNAIYQIDKEGFVTEVFRENAVIYSMILQGDVLLVGTGGEGNVYQVNPGAEETLVLAKVDAKEVMCLLPAKDGRIILGLANTGGISAMTRGYSTSGYYTSAVLDATQVSRFGNIELHGRLPDGATLKISTRSGNVKDENAEGWSKWSPDVDAEEFVKVSAPSARFLQYRLTFGTTDASKTALVDHVDVSYQIPNLGPVIKSVKIGGGSAPTEGPGSTPPPAVAHGGDGAGKPASGTGTQSITWDASDPNNDALVYTLYFRVESQGPWILLKDKLKDATYEWDTKTVADGRYQVKVVASDALANPPGQGKTSSRVSDSFVIDNTPPTIGDLTSKVTGNDVAIDLRVNDVTSTVANVEYTVDSNDDWQAVLPVDKIYDSPDETVSFTLKGLTPGPHQVTIRATDSRGNQALQTIPLKIEAVAGHEP